ncbi:hypothetical protein OM076_27345 [Solirubrobacter ginsenosidimutans]|uniref:Metallo-beta-lactamase domain-containing protein n=1 Tax=Solirubrobacter ginsenosidimutans TaxID=490573 RepID=A0A9X3N377_9ACTN|nr:hypothetical protein [Solirubrobacter ginsenosidimutans]MDA0164018.1 hypothetical protein [Solirubrobacter ginsenosidimutans]
MSLPICVTCGVQYSSPRDDCPICEDPRQYVPVEGQQWTSLEALRTGHKNAIRDEGALVGIGTEPRFAIGQRALLVPHSDGNVLWDCVSLLDDETEREIDSRGGLHAIAISHPHYYSTMVEWAHRFDCPVWLHSDDRAWAMREDPKLRFWSGETHDLGDGLTLIRCGGHFAGGTVLHRAGDLLAGDIVQVIPDRAWVSFMYSFPNFIPLGESEIRSIEAALEPFAFERIYGAWWGTVIPRDGKGIVQRSAQRYVDALNGNLP